MNLFELFVKIGADTSQAEKGMKNTQGVSETLANKIKVMSAQFEEAQKNVDKLTQEFNESVNKAGATDKATQELAEKLSDAEKEAGNFAKKLDAVQKELDAVQKEAEQSEKALDDCNEEIEDTGEKAEKSGKGLSSFASKLGKVLATAAKIGTAAVGAAASGITALTTAAVNNYAEYEQLVGGVETLFKGSADKVQEYAANAYKTAGMSANEYMSTVTSFSASLLQSLGGDTDKAAEYANQALTDMSDNANKMGTSMEMIQNAYQGFAKQNYTMLDNLKLGYGGTQSEMQRLIEDAAKLSDTVDAQDMSFGNIVKAINVVQTEMGITGTTAKEAASTIQGSVGMMKSSWTNLVTGLADENSNLGVLVENVISSAFTVVDNVLPRIEQALPSVATAITTAIPELITKISEVIDTALPTIIESAVSIIETLIQAISDNKDMLASSAITIITQLANGILNMLPEIIKLGLDLIVSLANGIAESLPELIPTIIDVMMQIVDTLTEPETLGNLLDAALVLLTELAYGLMEAIPALVDATLTIIEKLVGFLLEPENITKLLQAALEIVLAIGTGLVNSIPRIIESVVKLVDNVIDAIVETDWVQVGEDVVNGLLKGLKDMWGSLTEWFSDSWDGLVGGVKDLLGIHSPSRVFAGIGKNMALGVGEGWDDEFGDIQGNIDKSLAFDDPSMSINASVRKFGATAAGMAYGGTSIGNITINIDGAKYSDEQSLATAVAEALQNMTDRRAAVYA